MTDTENETLPLHGTVAGVIGDSAGWAWYVGKWRICQIAWSEEDNAHVLIMMIGEHTEIFLVDEVGELPWMPIHMPPYEGDEEPCTHIVTIMDNRASCTFAWSMNKSDGKSTVQKITRYIDAMLRDTNAPSSFGGQQ